jgi:hypothetical protein
MQSVEPVDAIIETWHALVEYIPNKDISTAAETLVSFFHSTLTERELLELVEQDDDLMAAYDQIVEPEPELDDEED